MLRNAKVKCLCIQEITKETIDKVSNLISNYTFEQKHLIEFRNTFCNLTELSLSDSDLISSYYFDQWKIDLKSDTVKESNIVLWKIFLNLIPLICNNLLILQLQLNKQIILHLNIDLIFRQCLNIQKINIQEIN